MNNAVTRMGQAGTSNSADFDGTRNAAVTNQDDVVGNTQGGRSADDSTPGVRTSGFVPGNSTVISDFRNDDSLKGNPDYKAAKAGDVDAAARLVQSLVKSSSLEKAKADFGDDVIYLPVHAEEASGRNSIPVMLACHYANQTGAAVGMSVVQSNRAFHTGANALERILSRTAFEGDVIPGKRYVLVDDVTTMGSTLADMASYIRAQGGDVVGSVVLVDASRSGKIAPDGKTIKQLEQRHGEEISKLFGIEPKALTWSESQYLLGFKSTDDLRSSAAKARLKRQSYLRAKGLLPEGTSSDIDPSAADHTSPTDYVSGRVWVNPGE